MAFEQLAEQDRVMFGKRLLEQFERVAPFERDGIHVRFELRPTGEAVLPGDHELGLAQGERGVANV